MKTKSRPKRWTEAVQAAQVALADLEELREEYEEWRDNLPDGLDSGELADKLETVVDLDFQSAMDVIEEAEMVDLPLGFGRD